MLKPSIIVKDLRVKSQEQTMLDGISFSLNADEHLAIIGDAESGKTSLAKAIAGKIHFTGSVTFNYDSNTVIPPRIIFVAQRYSFKNLSGSSEFYYQQRYNSFDSNDAPTIFSELLNTIREENQLKLNGVLKTLGILQLKNSPLIQLSSGEHKRFQIAKALLNPPQLLILDNPYTGLDIFARKELNTLLKEVTGKGTQIILIPGTFPVPGFITHTVFLENKELKFYGKKEDVDKRRLNRHREIKLLFNKDLMPVSSDNPSIETVVEMKNIHLSYGDRLILKNLSWKINKGEKWLLKGPNGCGKSSLLSMITGDHPQAYSNEIYLFQKRRGSGESIWDIKQKTGFISPEFHAYFDKSLSCFNAIASGYFDTIGLFKKLNTTQYNNILQWLDFLQLSHVSNKPLQSISAGLQRMILLTRALVKNPPLLVLDEPCQGLDENQSLQFISLIDHICKDSGKTLIYVSHDESNIPGCIEKILDLGKEVNKINSYNYKRSLAVA